MLNDMAVIPVLAGPVLVAMENLIVVRIAEHAPDQDADNSLLILLIDQPMYPTIVILLSALDRAPAETRFGTRGIGGSMKFAPPPPTFSRAMPGSQSQSQSCQTTASQLYSSGVRVPMDTSDSAWRHSRETYQFGDGSETDSAVVVNGGAKEITIIRQGLDDRSSSRLEEVVP